MEPECSVCGNSNSTRDPETGSRPANLETISLFPDVNGLNADSRFSSRYNSIPEIIEADPSFPKVVFDSKDKNYDMSGMKILYIFCHSSYNNFEKLKRPPSREGARRDADLMSRAFARYGFRFKIYYDLTYQQIIDRLSRVSQQDHARTSCLWVTIMTHSMGKEIFAADRLYKLSDIEVLLTSANLTGIPRILTLPCLRGGTELPEYLRLPHQPSETERLPCNSVVDLWRCCFRGVNQCMEPNEAALCPKCRKHNTDGGIAGPCASEGTYVHPTSSHLQYIYAANYDLVAMGILIRAICEMFDENEELDFLEDLIQGITGKVAKYTDPQAESIIPENSTYLTATVRFTCTVSNHNLFSRFFNFLRR